MSHACDIACDIASDNRSTSCSGGDRFEMRRSAFVMEHKGRTRVSPMLASPARWSANCCGLAPSVGRDGLRDSLPRRVNDQPGHDKERKMMRSTIPPLLRHQRAMRPRRVGRIAGMLMFAMIGMNL